MVLVLIEGIIITAYLSHELISNHLILVVIDHLDCHPRTQLIVDGLDTVMSQELCTNQFIALLHFVIVVGGQFKVFVASVEGCKTNLIYRVDKRFDVLIQDFPLALPLNHIGCIRSVILIVAFSCFFFIKIYFFIGHLANTCFVTDVDT